MNTEEQLWSHIEVNSDSCWIWVGSRDTRGYGRVRIGGKLSFAHRVSYVHYRGEITYELDHLCREHSCVNPFHLEDVTHQVNMSRGIHPLKYYCPQGHQYSEENTMVRSNLARVCKVCNQARRKAWRARTGRH